MDYRIQNDDVNIQVYERGNRQSATMIVFLHGGPGSGAKAIMEMKAFQELEKHYHCIYFDQRGSGQSVYDLQKGLNIEAIVHDVDVVIQDSRKRWKPRHIALWGGSFGGTLACLTMEYGKPDIDCLLLSNPAIYFSRKQALELFGRMQGSMAKRLGIEETTMGKTPEELFKDPAFIEFIFSDKNPSNSLRHVQAMSSWFFLHDYRHSLSCIQLPCACLNGREDPICDCQATVDALSVAKNDRLYWKVLPDCGHAVFEERTDEFVMFLHEFLQDVLS